MRSDPLALGVFRCIGSCSYRCKEVYYLRSDFWAFGFEQGAIPTAVEKSTFCVSGTLPHCGGARLAGGAFCCFLGLLRLSDG